MRLFWRHGTGVVTALLIFVAWEAAVRWFHPPVILLPAPSDIIADFFETPGYYLRQAGMTLSSTLAGFALAIILGVALAVAITASRVLDRLITTVLVMVNSLPKVALAPLFVIWLGVGAAPKVAIAVLLAIFAVVADVALGLRSVDPDALALARIHHASAWSVLVKIRLPNALPALFVGMKVAIGYALVGTIVGEFVGGSGGLGFVILTAQGQFDTTRVFTALTLLGVMGTVLFYGVEAGERMAVPWHVSQRR